MAKESDGESWWGRAPRSAARGMRKRGGNQDVCRRGVLGCSINYAVKQSSSFLAADFDFRLEHGSLAQKLRGSR